MFLKFEALIGTVTLTGSVSGKRNEWTVSITAPGGFTKTDETTEKTWFPLFSEMLAAASEAALRRRFPGRESASEARR